MHITSQSPDPAASGVGRQLFRLDRKPVLAVEIFDTVVVTLRIALLAFIYELSSSVDGGHYERHFCVFFNSPV